MAYFLIRRFAFVVRRVAFCDSLLVMSSFSLIFLIVCESGREKNPKFVEQVSLVCHKDDHIVVVYISSWFSSCLLFTPLSYGYKFHNSSGQTLLMFFCFSPSRLGQGCQSGMRSLQATVDLVNAVSAFLSSPTAR